MEETLEYELLDIEWELEYDFSQAMPVRLVKDGEEEPELPKEESIIRYDETGIPIGRRREEIKIREKLIKDFYAHWIESNPDKMVWNDDLNDYIHIKFISINETFAKAARTYESTCAVFSLNEILRSAVKVSEQPAKRNNNQKAYEKMVLMKALERVKLTVGLQKSTQEFVQYCISVPTNNEKSSSK